jgi:tetratricopeptide (TPR) repeat protein
MEKRDRSRQRFYLSILRFLKTSRFPFELNIKKIYLVFAMILHFCGGCVSSSVPVELAPDSQKQTKPLAFSAQEPAGYSKDLLPLKSESASEAQSELPRSELQNSKDLSETRSVTESASQNRLTASEASSFEKSVAAFNAGDRAQAVLWVRRSWNSAVARLGMNFEETVSKEPFRKVAVHFGKLLLLGSEFLEGERVFQVIISTNASDPLPYFELCSHHLSRSEFQLSERVARAGLSMVRSSQNQIYSCLIGALIGQKKLEDAFEQIKLARASFPEEAVFVSLLGKLSWMNGERTEACDLFKIALSRNKSDPASIFNEAVCLFSFGELQKAQTLLEEANSGVSFDPSVRYLLGQVYSSQGAFSSAEMQWQDFLRLAEPDDARRQIVELALKNLHRR